MTICKKVGYPTEHSAQVALVGVTISANRRSGPRKGGDRAKQECRWYQCNLCHLWHLTSQKQETGF